MSVRVVITDHYQELYGVDEKKLPQPNAGESVREYVARAKLGHEEDILPVVDEKAKSFLYQLKDGDVLTIYPLAASG